MGLFPYIANWIAVSISIPLNSHNLLQPAQASSILKLSYSSSIARERTRTHGAATEAEERLFHQLHQRRQTLGRVACLATRSRRLHHPHPSLGLPSRQQLRA